VGTADGAGPKAGCRTSDAASFKKKETMIMNRKGQGWVAFAPMLHFPAWPVTYIILGGLVVYVRVTYRGEPAAS